MRIRSFIVAYALVLAILLFADRRPGSARQDRYSHVVDLTDGPDRTAAHDSAAESRTRIIAPAALIPGTWAAGQIPPERLIAPLIVMDLNEVKTVQQINTYSWHPGTRAPQVYKVYGATGAEDGFKSEPRHGTNPTTCGWTWRSEWSCLSDRRDP